MASKASMFYCATKMMENRTKASGIGHWKLRQTQRSPALIKGFSLMGDARLRRKKIVRIASTRS